MKKPTKTKKIKKPLPEGVTYGSRAADIRSMRHSNANELFND